ncbi:hypothetical protein ASF43_09345 [Pseudorhodoferax sp. Leaf267]|nr:hypothetical protein ASF43_09345 [Pseudorhodoferax sp. Leaf267]
MASMEESRPDDIKTVLQDSGYGELADQWLSATSEFQTVAQQPLAADLKVQEVSDDMVRAYARMCVSWSRISQLRDQAMGSVEHLSYIR